VGGHELFTEAWARDYEDALDANEAYADAGEDWADPVALRTRVAPDRGIDEPRAVVLALRHGRCHDVDVQHGEAAGEEAPHVIEAAYGTWIDVLDGELEPPKAIMFDKLNLVQGSLTDLMRRAPRA
jgi:putative sterol carrier protein